MTVSADDDWWGLADVLEDRIRSLLPDRWVVMQVKDLTTLVTLAQQDNTVYLVPFGTRQVVSEGQGRVTRFMQQWGVVFAVQAANDPTGKEHRKLAGPVVSQVLRGLMGWQPGGKWRYLEFVDPPGADLILDNFAYFPFAVETAARLTERN